MPEDETTKNDYFEIRIPKIANGVPLLLTLILMAFSFLAGLMTMRYYSTFQQNQVATDATGAFAAYAKALKLDMNKYTACMESGKNKAVVAADVMNGSSLQVTATPTFFINGRMLLGAQPYSLFSAMIEQELSGNRTPLTEEESASQSAAIVDVAMGHLPALGKDSAKVTIVEFSDFQCPFCERFYTDTLPQLKKNYIDTGKVRLTFRDFPIESLHPNSPTAHEAAECAGEQGKFWEFHNKLFENQDIWANLPLTPITTST
jgi:protein-disulfide isomerase